MRPPRSVYLVDSHAAAAPPLPPRAGRVRGCTGLAQTILFMLVSVALTGLVLEGLLIFYLHSNHSVPTPPTSHSKSTAGMLPAPFRFIDQMRADKAQSTVVAKRRQEKPTRTSENDLGFIKQLTMAAEKKASPHPSTHQSSLSKPLTRLMEKKVSPHTCTPDSKPVAHLMDGEDAIHGKSIVGWSLISGNLLRGMDYKNGSLLIRREGFYFVYSKLSFHNNGIFHHTVMRRTRRHPGGNIPLLQAREYSSADRKDNRNTFLGGVFHLHKDDALFVKVSDTSKIVRVIAYENVFGAFMI